MESDLAVRVPSYVRNFHLFTSFRSLNSASYAKRTMRMKFTQLCVAITPGGGIDNGAIEGQSKVQGGGSWICISRLHNGMGIKIWLNPPYPYTPGPSLQFCLSLSCLHSTIGHNAISRVGNAITNRFHCNGLELAIDFFPVWDVLHCLPMPVPFGHVTPLQFDFATISLATWSATCLFTENAQDMGVGFGDDRRGHVELV